MVNSETNETRTEEPRYATEVDYVTKLEKKFTSLCEGEK